jgi:hypothetical protein
VVAVTEDELTAYAKRVVAAWPPMAPQVGARVAAVFKRFYDERTEEDLGGAA